MEEDNFEDLLDLNVSLKMIELCINFRILFSERLKKNLKIV